MPTIQATLLERSDPSSLVNPSEWKRWIARLVMIPILGLLCAAGVHAQSAYQLVQPAMVDDIKQHDGSSLLSAGKIILKAFSADGAGGEADFLYPFPYETKVINGKATACAAASVKTTFKWAFQPNATILYANQKVALWLVIQQDQSCHNMQHPIPYITIVAGANSTDFEPTENYANNPEGRYYGLPPAGVMQSDPKIIAITPANSLPIASFMIKLNFDTVVDVPYGYNRVAAAPVPVAPPAVSTAPATLENEIALWVQARRDARFGGAIASTFQIFPNWQAGWTLAGMKFMFRGTNETVVYMAYQNGSPQTRWMMYYDPDTAKMTAWVAY